MLGQALKHPQVAPREIKSTPLTADDLGALYARTGSYEALFNKRAQRLRTLNTPLNQLGEKDYRNLLLEHYSFLKRPVLLSQQEILIGNSAPVKEAVEQLLTTLNFEKER